MTTNQSHRAKVPTKLAEDHWGANNQWVVVRIAGSSSSSSSSSSVPAATGAAAAEEPIEIEEDLDDLM